MTFPSAWNAILEGENPHNAGVLISVDTRKTGWTTTDIIIRLHGVKQDPNTLKPNTYSSKSGVRRSSRLRETKERRLTISKSTTIRDVKVMVGRSPRHPPYPLLKTTSE